MDTFDTGDVILDKYEVTNKLGEGGMGCVLAARDRELDRLVALKFLRSALRDRPDSVSRFEREARTAARIQNDHVARVLGVEKVDGVPFMVMEHLRGHDLSSEIGKRGRLDVTEAVDFVLQASEAVAEAHTLGIVHRDLKPANLFLAETSDGMPIIKVLDFGISKTAATDEVSLTGGTAMLGSPVYMSPEQLESARSVDARSDIWSLGVVLYELLTGTPPFTGETIANVWTAIRNGSYEKLSDRRNDIPPGLEQMLSETLAVERKHRLPSVEAFAAKLAPFGTDDGRASYARIQRITSRATPAPKPAEASVDLDWPVGTGDETKDTASALVQSKPQASAAPTHRASRRWATWSALGVASAAAVVIGVIARPGASAPTASSSASEAASAASPAVGAAPPAISVASPAMSVASAAPAASVDASEAACDNGDGAACNSAGKRYALGESVTRDDEKAFSFYKRACDHSFALGCLNVGAMLFEGTGVLKDEALGAELFVKACEGGAPLGCLNVSIAYATGRGVPKDPAQSFEYAARACAGGVLAGCVRVATAKLTGDGVTKDVKGGLAQLDTLCKQGEKTACEKVAALYVKGDGTDVPKDGLRARAAAAKGCEAGSGRACEQKEGLATVSSGAVAVAQYNAMFQQNCDKGMLVGCAMLGKDLVDGIGTPKDVAKGTALLQKACAGHVAQACDKLAEMGKH